MHKATLKKQERLLNNYFRAFDWYYISFGNDTIHWDGEWQGRNGLFGIIVRVKKDRWQFVLPKGIIVQDFARFKDSCECAAILLTDMYEEEISKLGGFN